jgi:energy-coupling factor transporter ATP-binding protein EcfA2
LRGRVTVVVIAHRPSTVRGADHVIVLDQGRLVAAGSWSEVTAVAGPLLAQLAPTDPLHERLTPTDPLLERLTPTDPLLERLTPTDPLLERLTPIGETA